MSILDLPAVTNNKLTAYAATATALASAERSLGCRFDDFRSSTTTTLASRNGGKLVSGHVWNFDYLGGGTAADLKIVNNALRYDAAGASYFWTTGSADAVANQATVEFYFEAGSTVSAGMCVAFSKRTVANVSGADGVFANSIHIVISPTNYAIGIYDGPSAQLSNFSAGSLSLPTNGTRLTLHVKRLSHDRINMVIPGYLDITARDYRVPMYWGSTFGVEHYQPAGTFATDARLNITAYSVSEPNTRAMPLDGPANALGLPGGLITYYGVLAFGTGITRYYPLEVRDPITVTGARSEITTAGASGAKIRMALYSADAAWQPKTLVVDFGEFASDATGIVGPTGLSVALPAGRYVLADKASADATRRYYTYQIPGIPVILPTMGAGSFTQSLNAIEAYGTWPTTATTWTGYTGSGAYGYLCPTLLSWVGA